MTKLPQKNSDRPSIPVPHYMRTNRLAPRILATGCLCFSLTLLLLSGNALARHQLSQTPNPINRFSPGSNHFVVVSPEQPERCFQATTLNLTPKSTQFGDSIVELHSEFFLGSQNQRIAVQLNSRATFDYLGELQQVHADLLLGGLGSMQLKMQNTIEPLTVHLSGTDTSTKVFTLPPVSRVFLVESQPGSYRIRIPAHVALGDTQFGSTYLQNFKLRQATLEETTACQQALPTVQPLLGLSLPTSTIVQLGEVIFSRNVLSANPTSTQPTTRNNHDREGRIR